VSISGGGRRHQSAAAVAKVAVWESAPKALRAQNAMGVSLAWVGVQAMSAAEVQATLGLTDTGSTGNYYDFPMGGVVIPNNWYLLAAKPCDHAIRSEPILSELSARSSVMACSIEEHVMFMSAALWRGGREVWSVQHRGGDYGETDLVVKGSPPDTFESLRARCFAAQESASAADIRVDYVADIPLELARSFVGFRHDMANPEIDGRFHALQLQPDGRLAKAARPWWKFW
jgi:hypothetical protein